MESVQWGHPERAMPFCVKNYRILDSGGRVLSEVRDNHQTRNVIVLDQAVKADKLIIEIREPNGPTAIFQVRCSAE